MLCDVTRTADADPGPGIRRAAPAQPASPRLRLL